MTTGCIEYWFMLHYKMLAPPLETVEQKQKMISEIKKIEPTYEKGDVVSTNRIAENYPKAVTNARKTLQNLLSQGLPGLEEDDVRNRWLCTQCKTFSTVYEAIEYLENL
jgi:hypothetical protein